MYSDPNITAKIVADTRAKTGVRITTFEIVFPRIILAEVNTHRLLSKSSASSRAIPVSKRIDAMDAGLVYRPNFEGAVANKPGMQATERISDDMIGPAKMIWDNAVYEALENARQLNSTGVHKQFVNRLLEPFMYQKTVVTATEWDNFFKLRNHPDAQPEFQDLASKMEVVLGNSTPSAPLVVDNLELHLPYYDAAIDGNILPLAHARGPEHSAEGALLVSSARCARVSYNSFVTGKRSTRTEDYTLAGTLTDAGHMSPFDHAAMADHLVPKLSANFWASPEKHRQFFGWIPFRVDVEARLGYQGRRDSFGEIKNIDLR